MLASILYAGGDTVGAKAAYQWAIESNNEQQARRAWTELADMLMEQGDWEGAAKASQNLLEYAKRDLRRDSSLAQRFFERRDRDRG